MRLVDWDKVLKWMHRQKETTEQWSMRIAIENFVDDMPTVDAEPVRHGRWEFTDDAMFGNPFGSYKCSECGNTEPHKTKYCSNCGCKMGVDINGTD